MKTFVVYEPENPRAADSAERAVFVREKFSWTAFFFAPLWLLFNRLWLAFVLFCAAEILIACGLYFIGLRGPAALAALLLAPLIVAFEGAQLQRFQLQRKEYRETDVVIANDLVSAERRYFERRKSSGPARAKSSTPAKSATLPRTQRVENSILGLFPAPWRGR